jgi:hypothetical protein
VHYELIVEGTVGPLVCAALEGFEPRSSEAGRTRLVGELEDQTALRTTLHMLDDLHVVVLEMRRLPDNCSD